MVYMIQARDGAIKIGVSSNPYKRLAVIKTASPGAILLGYSFFKTRKDALEIEASMHNSLKEYCIGGEWFMAPYEELEREQNFLCLCGRYTEYQALSV